MVPPGQIAAPPQVQQEIVDALKQRAIEPQAVVATVQQNTSLISVLGDVNTPARFPANAGGEHILDFDHPGGRAKEPRLRQLGHAAAR